MSDSKATALKVASQRLDQVSLPVLVAQGAGLSAEVAFKGRMHAVALIAHARELLGSFILLVEHARWPASTAVARCLFELAASGFYFLHKLKPALETADYDEALRVVNLAMSSSRLMNKYASPPWTESINVLTIPARSDRLGEDVFALVVKPPGGRWLRFGRHRQRAAASAPPVGPASWAVAGLRSVITSAPSAS